MKKIPLLFALLLLFSLSGCAGRINLDQARQAGARQLSADNINTLVAGNSLHMVSWNKADEADIDFSEKGTLNAINSVGEKTHGRWTTDRDKNTLCLKFKFWGDGATNCFQVFKDQEHYLLFNNDGTLAHTFVPEYEVEYTLADLNAGVLAQPPTRAQRLPRQTATQAAAAAPAAAPAAKGGLLSTLTFGVLGAGEGGEAEEIAPQEFVATTKRLSQPHQQLLDSGDCPGCNLADLDLSGTKLKGANLQGADLSGANLQEVNLSGANLKGANLRSARLTDALLMKADLENADLRDANLHWADLSKANLKNANLERAYLVKAFFYRADLTGANMKGVQSQRTIFEKALGVPEELLKNNTNQAD